MPREIYINSTLAFCTHCSASEFARIVSRDGKVYLERMCPQLGVQSVIIAADDAWYRERMHLHTTFPEPKVKKDAVQGCPKDCGICEWHSNAITLPIFSITNDCNLDCPKCFTYNRQDAKYYKSVEETKQIIGEIVRQSGGVQVINLTGGEPTLHPDLFAIIDACRQEGIDRITMNTNGLRIAADRDFAQRIKESGVQLVLSLDTLSPERSRIIYGRNIVDAKLKALEYFEELDIPVTILSVAIKNLNERDIADIASTYLKRGFVRSLTVQNMTFTGLNGSQFEPREHITIDEVERALCVNPEFSGDDFFPLASYHPLCYSVAYYFSKDGVIVPLRKLLSRDKLIRMSAESYFINPGQNLSTDLMNGINALWAEGADESMIRMLKQMIAELYPNDREISREDQLRYVERHFKMIYIHPHMDEDNFDIDRVSRCGDIVPDEQGRMIPACSYNLLYRQEDTRFWVQNT